MANVQHSNTQSLRNFISLFNFKSIKGKIVILCCSSLLMLVALSFINYNLTNKTKNINNAVVSNRVPATLTLANLITSLEKSSSLQQAYLITENETLKQERLKLWSEKINPLLGILKSHSTEWIIEKNRTKVDSLTRLLPLYFQLQEEIDDLVRKENEAENAIVGTETLESSETLYHNEVKSDQDASSLISTKSIPVQNEISTLLDQLFLEQEEMMKGNINRMKTNLESSSMNSIITLITGFIIILVLSIITVRSISSNIQKAVDQLKTLSTGEITQHIVTSTNELGQVIESGNILAENINGASQFASAIGEGNFEMEFRPASDKDVLGNSLLQMRNKLIAIAEADKRRNWSIEGLAKIVEILRSSNQDIKSLSDNIISNLVKYVKANQGGLFIVNNEDYDDIFIELKACYAYDKKKYIEKRIEIGQGLIGQVYREGETIYLTEIPNNYVHITTGLGEATPTHLLIVPLKLNDEVEGIIELASFKSFENHEIEFVEKLGESIASSIASIKITERTTYLLEQSQVQTEQMRAQEEEMRQNLEELQATQEQMHRKESELENILQETLDKEKRLKEKTLELEQMRLEEKERDMAKSDASNKLLTKLNEKFGQKEQEYMKEIANLKNQIEELKIK